MHICKVPLEVSKMPHYSEGLWEENWVLWKGMSLKCPLSVEEEEEEIGPVVFREIELYFTCKTKTLLISDIGKIHPPPSTPLYYF